MPLDTSIFRGCWRCFACLPKLRRVPKSWPQDWKDFRDNRSQLCYYQCYSILENIFHKLQTWMLEILGDLNSMHGSCFSFRRLISIHESDGWFLSWSASLSDSGSTGHTWDDAWSRFEQLDCIGGIWISAGNFWFRSLSPRTQWWNLYGFSVSRTMRSLLGLICWLPWAWGSPDAFPASDVETWSVVLERSENTKSPKMSLRKGHDRFLEIKNSSHLMSHKMTCRDTWGQLATRSSMEVVSNLQTC